MRKVTENNYRKFYKEYYGIDFNKELVIHHMDENRQNNDIENLILIPKSLHAQYHVSLSRIRTFDVALNGTFQYHNGMTTGFELGIAQEYLEIMSKMIFWMQFKDYKYIFLMDNQMPNIRKLWERYGLIKTK